MSAALLPTGLYAFPFVTATEVCPGMDLRDYFAAAARPPTIRCVMETGGPEHLTPEQHVALLVYRIADAMLAERVK